MAGITYDQMVQAIRMLYGQQPDTSPAVRTIQRETIEKPIEAAPQQYALQAVPQAVTRRQNPVVQRYAGDNRRIIAPGAENQQIPKFGPQVWNALTAPQQTEPRMAFNDELQYRTVPNTGTGGANYSIQAVPQVVTRRQNPVVQRYAGDNRRIIAPGAENQQIPRFGPDVWPMPRYGFMDEPLIRTVTNDESDLYNYWDSLYNRGKGGGARVNLRTNMSR